MEIPSVPVEELKAPLSSSTVIRHRGEPSLLPKGEASLLAKEDGPGSPSAGSSQATTATSAAAAATGSSTPEPEFGDHLQEKKSSPIIGVQRSQDDVKRQLPTDRKLTSFLWTSSPQPHAVRRRAILEKYPEIEDLYGADPWQIIPIIGCVIVQLYMARLLGTHTELSWPVFALVGFVVSGTLNHSLFAAMHEASHRTILEGKYSSELLCILCTVPMAVPAAIPFKRYHLDHHIYMGVDGMDPDLPTKFEAKFFQSFAKKLLWISLLPATYSFRPMIIRPKPIRKMDVFSWVVCVTVDSLVYFYWGKRALLYLMAGAIFSMNFHPWAGHFLAEHFVFPEAKDAYQETSSYYGIWNKFTYNLGYHIEHHDFPRIAGTRLPMVTKTAPEFYDIPQHYGWARCLWKFITSPIMTPYNRIKRVNERGGQVASENAGDKLHDKELPFGGERYFWPKVSS